MKGVGRKVGIFSHIWYSIYIDKTEDTSRREGGKNMTRRGIKHLAAALICAAMAAGASGAAQASIVMPMVGAMACEVGESQDLPVYVFEKDDVNRMLNLNGAYYAYSNEMQYGDDLQGRSFAFFDIDKDGVPEMLERRGNIEAEYIFHVTRYDDGCNGAGTLPASHSVLIESEGALYLCTAHQGYASKYWISLDEDHQVTASPVFLNREYNTFTNDEEIFEFSANSCRRLEEYTSADTYALRQIFLGFGYEPYE